MEPSEEHAKTVEECVRRFHAAPKARLRRVIVRGFFGVAAVLLVLALSPLGGLLLTAGVMTLVLVVLASYFMVSGAMGGRTCSGSCANWPSAPASVAGSGDSASWRYSCWSFGFLEFSGSGSWPAAWPSRRQSPSTSTWTARSPAPRKSIAQVQEILNELRQSGQDQAQLQGFVARYGGPHWEEFFEALFGYEAKLAARRQWGIGDDGRRRKRFRAWRDPILRWIDEKSRSARKPTERRHIQEVEERALRAKGISPEEARRRAADVARAMVYRAALAQAAAESTRAAQAATRSPKRPTRRCRRPARQPRKSRKSWREAVGGMVYAVFALLFGQRMRLLLGFLLVAGCALWAYQNDVLRQPDQEDFQQAWQHGKTSSPPCRRAGARASSACWLGSPRSGPPTTSRSNWRGSRRRLRTCSAATIPGLPGWS